MDNPTRKSVAIFANPFMIPGFDETLPAGEYDIETELGPAPDHRALEGWKASVLVNLHPRASHPGLSRTLTVSLADLEEAHAKDKLTGREIADLFLDEMLADPMVRMVMEADGVSEMQLRHLYSGRRLADAAPEASTFVREVGTPQEKYSIQAAENEGMPPQPN